LAHWDPLGYHELVHHVSTGAAVTISLSSVEMSIRGPRVNSDALRSMKAVFTPKGGRAEIFALVPGGWLPVPLLPADVLYPDANIAKNVPSLAGALSANPTWPIGVGGRRISPLLPALEGNRRGLPASLNEIEQLANEVADKLKKCLPGQVHMPTTDAYLGAWGLVGERRQDIGKESAFLQQILPRLSRKVSQAELRHVYDDVESAAERNGIQRNSFLYLLTLDCLFDHQFVGNVKSVHQSAGRLVLKPKPTVSSEQIYNALFDIWILKFASLLPAVTKQNSVAVCTRDFGLAKAWALFSPRQTTLAGPRQANLTLNVDDFALRLDAELREELLGSLG
jgi:hypothetical protein